MRSHTLNAEAYTEHIYYMPYMPIYTPYMPKPYIYSIQNIHIQLIYIYIFITGPYLGFESNFHFFLCPILGVKDNVCELSDQTICVSKLTLQL